MDPKERFPEKVYDVANDGYLVSWNGCGDGVVVNEKEFERKVMRCYPGFVKISSFANFRRLFREYGFDWEIIDRSEKHSYTFEFSHQSFRHGHRDMLCDIQTRRKSFNRPVHILSNFHEEVAEISAFSHRETEGRLVTRTSLGRIKRVNYADLQQTKKNKSSLSSESIINSETESSFITDNEDLLPTGEVIEWEEQEQQRKFEFDLRAQDFMKTFIQNEFTFDEFCVWVERNQHVFINHNEFNGSRNDFNDNSGSDGPCGYCSCCRSIMSFLPNCMATEDGNFTDQ
jgi:hypothetical protein